MSYSAVDALFSFQKKYHGISVNLRTPRRRLREFGLRRRNEVYSEHEVWEIIKREIEGPSSLLFLKTEQLYYNEILFQSNVQWQMPHLTNCVTHFSVRVSFKFHIDGRIAHCSQILPHICGRTSQQTWYSLVRPRSDSKSTVS